MNVFERLDPGGPALLLAASSAAIVAVVAISAEALARGLARRGAATRHEVYLVALLIVLASPMLAVSVGRSGLVLITLPGERPSSAPAIPEPEAEGLPPDTRAIAEPEPTEGPPPIVDAGPVPAPPPMPSAEARRRPESPRWTWSAVRGALAGIWAAGAVVLAVRLVFGLVAMIRLRRRAWPIDAASIAGVLEDVRAALVGRHLPPIVEVDSGLAGPVTAGLFRPTVVLPGGLADRLDAAALRDVLLHEVAHAFRRDGLVGLLQRVAALAFWPHPLVHRLNRRLSRAREEACDDVVLGRGDPARYARTLLLLAEGIGPGRVGAAVGLFEAHWRLEDRVARVLDPGRPAMTRANRAATLSAAALLAMTAVVVAAVRPAPEAQEPGKVAVAVKGAGDEDAWRAGPGTAIRGTVVDEAGAPVAGAAVRAKGYEKSDDAATSGADGRFLLRVGGPFRVHTAIIAEADGGARLGFAAHDDMAIGPPESLRIVLKPARPLTVRVKDAAGRPVAGAAVSVDSSGFYWCAVDPGTSDSEGIARFRVPADVRVQSVSALKDGLGADYHENYRGLPARSDGPPPPEVSLTLDGARTATVTAVGSDGRPVPGLTLHVFRLSKPGKLQTISGFGQGISSTVTDGRGMARFPWIPPSAGVSVSLYPRGHSADNEFTVGRDTKGDVDGTIRVVRDGRLSGRVTRADGSPARGVMVRAQGWGPIGLGTVIARSETRTDGDGAYSLSVQPEHIYGLGVVDRDRAATPYWGLSFREGESREGLDFRLVVGTRLHGRIIVPPGPASTFPPRVMMSLVGPELPASMQPSAGILRRQPDLKRRLTIPMSLRPDDEGRYEVRLAAGEYEFRDLILRKSEFLRVDGTGEIARDFTWAIPPSFELAGTVVDASRGAARPPVSGALVRLFRPGRPVYANVQALSGPDGRFTLNRTAAAALHAKDRDGTLAALADVAADAKDVVLALAPAATVSGRLVAADGRPVVGNGLSIRRALGPGDGDKGAYHEWLRCDRDGRFLVAGLVPGLPYKLVFTHQGGDEAGEEVPLKTLPISAPGPIDLGELIVPAGRPAR